METQNTKSKNQTSPSEQVVFIEYSTVKKGQHFMTVMSKENGRRKIQARIFREWDGVEKKMKYTAKDREGKEIFPADFNLYALKKKFTEAAKEKVQQLAQAVPAQEKNEPARAVILPGQQQAKEKAEKKSIGKRIKDKAQEFTQDLVDAPMKDEDPIANGVIEEMKRESELKEMRDEKENGKAKDKGLSR
jgi:hypothetical protein